MIKHISHLAPFGLRIPEELKAMLEESAEENARSLNGEMIVRLTRSFNRPLSEYSDGDLIAEIMSRYERDTVYIRIGKPNTEPDLHHKGTQ